MSFNSSSPSRPWFKRTLACVLGIALLGNAIASPTWHDEIPDALVVGKGEMRWLSFRIYRAVLWGNRQPFEPGSKFALQLTYYRSISRDRLVNTSMDEMRRLGSAPIDEAEQARWKYQLQRAFVDVQPGDQLTGVNIPGYGMRFYYGEKQVADIGDPVLAKAFFDIWLNEKSRDRELRGQLLGRTP